MDYDDNDISRHTPQLASEGRSRSSSVLRPYDFPKFDFSDNLQGHLKFDSLVETEVFLGIPSQEDNQWIEDYSQVSNGMEFNATPADSCSISRRDNVWSEATSSESVEMLLKSVGQEEMMPSTSIIVETNECDDQSASARHVESAVVLDMINLDTVGPQDKVHLDPSQNRLLEVQLPRVEVSSVNSENAGFPCEHPHDQSHDTARARSGMPANEGEHDIEPGDENSQEPILFGSQVAMLGTSEASLQINANVLHVSCNESGLERHVPTGTELEDILDSEEKTRKSSIDISTVGGTPRLVPESRVVNIADAVEASLDCPEPTDLGSIPSIKESELIFPEGDEKIASLRTSVQTDDCEVKALVTSSGMKNPLDRCQDGSFVDGSNQHSAELGCFTENCTSPDRKRDSSTQMIDRKDYGVSEDVQTSQSQSKTLSETPLSTMENIEVSTERADWINKNDIGKSSKTDLLSSDAENHQTQVEGCVDDSAFTQERLGANLAGDVAGDSRKVIEENLARAQAEFSATRGPIRESSEQDVKFPVCPGNMDSEEVETLTTHLGTHSQRRTLSETPSLTMENNEVSTERADWINKNDPGQSSNTELLSSDAENHQTLVEACVDDSAFTQEGLGANLSGDVAGDSRKVIEENLDRAQAEFSATGEPIFESSESDGKFPVCPGNMDPENVETQTTHLGTHSVGEDAHIGCGAGSFSEVEAASDSGRTPLVEVDATSLPSIKKCNDVSSSESPSAEAISSLDLDNPVVNIGCEKSSLKGSRDDDIGGGGKQQLTMMKLEGDQESTQVAEVDKDSCGSPTIISSSEPSRMETNDHEEARASEVTENVVKGSQPASEDMKGKNLSGEDNTFTFKVNAMPDATREPGKSWSPFHADKCNSTIVGKESRPSCKGKSERLPSPKTPRQSAQLTDVQPLQGASKCTYERKGRRASGKGATKESAKKGSRAKGTNQENSSGIVDKGLNSSLITPSSSPYVQFGHMQSYGNVEESSKRSLAGILPTSNLPDLNASTLNKSTSTSPTSRQPFTDLQQVQLRAQIFVYGSLIQGTAPDEACMVSAFGPSDAGRITWEPVWRSAIERVRSQKSSSSNTLTPLPSQSGARTGSDLAVKHSSHPSKVQATPVSKVSSKDTPATTASPMIPLSSPLWSISTPLRDGLPSSTLHKGPVVDFQQAVTPLHSYQTPPIRSFNGHTPWPSQTCFPASWLGSPQTATFTPSVRFQPVTMTETVKLTPVKDNSLPAASGVKHMASTPAISVGPSPVYGVVSPPHDTKTTPPELHSGDSKPRKRKKISASCHVHSASASEPQTLPEVIHSVDALRSSPVDYSTVCSTDPSKKCEQDTMKAVACSEETLKNVAEAKTQAENASVLAANAVAHCEDLWGQLAKQKESGLTSEIATKLISAAAAIAAAASVAKAGAAAVKVAFSAALQAKLLADEAFLSSQPGVVDSSSEKSSVDVHYIGNASPSSILKGKKSSTESNSILVAAKEAAKRRVEAASAASKQAENLDAIVKAAELAALAVSQAGKIVAMGEPLPLIDFIEAGPDGYWKLPQTPAELTDRSKDEKKDQSDAIDMKDVDDVHAKASVVHSVAKGGSRKRSHFKTRQREGLKDSVDAEMNFTDGITGSMDTDGKNSRSGRDGEKSNVVTPAPESALRTSSMQNEHENSTATPSDESIKEGSHVEVLKGGGSLKSAWYSANVLKIEDGKAYVCYSDLSSVEGSGNLCEWVCFEGEGEKAPVIRAAHPLNSLQHQGTRKRRRAALSDYAWGVGDKVDVWIDDCWWEGVVTEKNEKDETTLKVHFPAQGETSIVRAWNLRTSRSWIDGKWVEWSSWKTHHSSDQNDTPQEKRQKMGSPVVVANEMDKLDNEKNLAVGNPVESNFLPLSTSEKTFDVGKVTKEDSKGVARRPLRSGQRKEGSRVVFGVPKPTGKTRKFMDVSKQFPASKGDKSKEASDQVKYTKYLMPPATGSQGWKVPSRNYSRENRTVESRPKVPSTRKSHRTLPQRDNLGSRSGDVDSGTHHGTDVDDSVGRDVNSSVKMSGHGFNVNTEESAEAPLSSLISQSSSSSKKGLLSNSRSGRLNRGKLAPSGGKLSKIEEDKVYAADSGKFVNEATEPRRSNRRFQPTHRLLEGLQSSMVIPKMLSVSHDKGQRNPSRNVFTRGK